MMMQLLTQKNHPKRVLVNRVRDDYIIKSAQQIRRVISRPDISAIVLLRDVLSTDFAKCNGELTSDPIGFDFSVRPQEIRLKNENAGTTVLREIEEKFGPDFRLQIEFLQNYGPTNFYIRATDFSNATPHVDTSIRLSENEEFDYPLLEAGTTNIMAIRGGSTVLIDAPESEFFINEDANNNGKLFRDWEIAQNKNYSDATYQPPEGAIIISKSKGWAQNHYPMPHNSPKRLNGNSPLERIVGIGFSR